MQSDIDAQLTSFFEETPPRDFAKVMRGYDPHQVDEHIRQLANEVRRHQEDALGARRDLQDAQRQIQEQERPTLTAPSCGPRPRTRPRSSAPTPSASPTTCAARRSARRTRSAPPPGARR